MMSIQTSMNIQNFAFAARECLEKGQGLPVNDDWQDEMYDVMNYCTIPLTPLPDRLEDQVIAEVSLNDDPDSEEWFAFDYRNDHDWTSLFNAILAGNVRAYEGPGEVRQVISPLPFGPFSYTHLSYLSVLDSRDDNEEGDEKDEN